MILISIAVAIVIVLSGIALYYTIKLKQLNKKRAIYDADVLRRRTEKEKYIVQSIMFLSRGVLAEQLTLTEASIRISGLLDTLDLAEETREQCSVFTQLSEACQHIPILDAWKALPKKEKQRFNKEREYIEENYRDFVLAAAEKMVKGEIFINQTKS